jgi:N-methylhydantoinase A/oxoprolinase/acetone carboxylase beta subunit
MSYSQQRTVRMPVGTWDAGALGGIRDDLRAQVTAPLGASGFGDGDIVVQEVAALRYSGQSYAIEIPDPDFDALEALGRRFFALHHKLYGYATDEPWQLEAIRMRASVPGKRKRIGAPPPAQAAPVAVKTLPCVFDDTGPVPTPRYRRGDIGTASTIQGPAIIEDDHATIVIDPGASAFADASGHLHILTGAHQ